MNMNFMNAIIIYENMSSGSYTALRPALYNRVSYEEIM